MRTTIDVPEDLHQVLASLANTRRKSLSQTAVELMHRGLEGPTSSDPTAVPGLGVSPRMGLPQVSFPRIITAEDVRALDDEG